MDNSLNAADDTIETKLIKLNEKLSQKCHNFIITFTKDQSNQMDLSLINESKIVSNIHIFIASYNMIYINIDTLPEYEENGFITFLMAVLVYIYLDVFIPVKSNDCLSIKWWKKLEVFF